MFTCKKCNEPFNITRVEDRGHEVKLYVVDINGHRSDRKVSKQQAIAMAGEVFAGVFNCIECGQSLHFASKDLRRNYVTYSLVCPIHGIQKKEIATAFHNAIDQLRFVIDITSSINDAFICPKCEKEFTIRGMKEEHGLLHIETICPEEHKEKRYLTKTIPADIWHPILRRTLRCDKCGIQGQLLDIEKRGRIARIKMNCAVHGEARKEIPVDLVDQFKTSIGVEEEAPQIHSILDCHECWSPLAIRSIMSDRKGYKIKCKCANGHESEMSMPLHWDTQTAEAIAAAIIRCRECGLLSSIIESDVSKKKVDFIILCPIHGDQKKGVSIEVYKQIEDYLPKIELTSSVNQSMRCSRCHTPFIIKDSKIKRDTIEFDVECRNGHRDARQFAIALDQDSLVQVYDHMFECPKCHGKLELNDIQDETVLLECVTHGEMSIGVPQGHEEAIRTAYTRSVNLEKLEKLVNEEFQTKPIYEFTMDEEADIMENLQLVMHVISEHGVQFVAEKTTLDGSQEVWYFGITENNDEFVVIGSASEETRVLGIRIAAEDESKVNTLSGKIKESFRELLLKRRPETGEFKPITIVCPHCKSPLSKRALPGETITCDYCGTPLHWT